MEKIRIRDEKKADPGWKKFGSGMEKSRIRIRNTVRNTDLSPVTMLGAGLVFSQQLEIPPGHSSPAEPAVGGGGPVSPHSQPGEQGEALVQLQHRLDSSRRHEIEYKIRQKIYNFRCRILLDNFSVDGEKKDCKATNSSMVNS